MKRCCISEMSDGRVKLMVNIAGVYIVGEIFNGDPTYVCPYQNYMNGVLNYPA